MHGRHPKKYWARKKAKESNIVCLQNIRKLSEGQEYWMNWKHENRWKQTSFRIIHNPLTYFGIQLSGEWRDSPIPGHSILFFFYLWMAQDTRLLLFIPRRRNGVQEPAVLIPLKQTNPLRISIKCCNHFSLTKDIDSLFFSYHVSRASRNKNTVLILSPTGISNWRLWKVWLHVSVTIDFLKIRPSLT